MQKPAYFILTLLTEFPLDTHRLKQELLQFPYFHDSSNVDSWIERLTTKDWIQYRDNKYFVTQTGLDKLINQFHKK